MAKPSKRKQGMQALQNNIDNTRLTWNRKPQTQIVPNKKAEQRRSFCRKGRSDDAVFLFLSRLNIKERQASQGL
ncbi:hypothetical protein EBB07_14280 [Paenibacillaceae bacterium]|nr:hypothetical protein EBB07_14280 [Paenibacillaceae bacterium]